MGSSVIKENLPLHGMANPSKAFLNITHPDQRDELEKEIYKGFGQ
jgi:hypothetical protein